MSRVACLFAAACLLAAAFAGCGRKPGAGASRTVKLSHITSDTSHWHAGGERFAELASKRTGGRYKVKVYPGGQIANHNQRTELQMLQGGSIETAFVSPIILALFLDGRFDAFSAPWLFPDLETARRACTGELFAVAREWLGEKRLVALAVGVNGFRQLTNSVRPVRSPADMKGVKFRVAGTDLFLETFRSLGANAITMNFGEVFTSLQEGAIDGQENPLAIISSSHLCEVQDHLTLWDYAFDPIFLIANGSFWDSVPEVDRGQLASAAREAMEYQWDYAEKLESDILDDLRSRGMQIVRLSSAELGEFKKAAAPAYRFLEEKTGADLVDSFRRIVASTAAERPAAGR